jgi:hypothetical protein
MYAPGYAVMPIKGSTFIESHDDISPGLLDGDGFSGEVMKTINLAQMNSSL